MIKLIGIVGGREISEETAQMAYQVGRLIAQKGYALVCGGMGGVMEAASRGCKEAGGLTVAIIPQDEAHYANFYMDVVIPSGMGVGRNVLILRSAAGVIAIDGKYGTLSEIAYAFQLNRPIVGLHTWDVSPDMPKAQNAEEAVRLIIEKIEHGA